MIRSYEDLIVYQKGYKLSLEIHQLTQQLPQKERYELGSQLRKAAVSIPANIAEGYGKKRSEAEFKRFLLMSLGSCNEVQVYLNMCNEYLERKEEFESKNVAHFNIIKLKLVKDKNKHYSVKSDKKI
mgnify:CR=1 FL=1